MTTPRQRLEEALLAKYNLQQLSFIVDAAIDEKLEAITLADNLTAVIHELLDYLLTNDRKLSDFMAHLREKVIDSRIRIAVQEFMEEQMGEPIPQTNPYEELVIAGEPFVDRAPFRKRLGLFFNSPYERVFALQGPRESGRTYKSSFIRRVAEHEGLNDIYIDLDNNTLNDVIFQFRTEMKLPEDEFRDLMAQAATKTKGLVSVIRGACRDFVAKNQKWSIVIDHLDRKETNKELREFTELLLIEAKNQRLPNIYVIVLGHAEWTNIPITVSSKFVTLPVTPLIDTDFEKYIDDLASYYDEHLTPEALAERKRKVLEGMTPPFNLKNLMDINDRLKEYIK